MTESSALATKRMSPVRKLLYPTLATIISLIILLNLGFWQLGRLDQKTALIARVEAGVSADPVPAPGPEDWKNLTIQDDYKNVSLSGEFLEGVVFYYTALTDSVGPYNGPGYLIYSPFKTSDGWTIMLNRGFIPQEVPEPIRQKAITAPSGQQTIIGLLRLSEKPTWTTPAADPKSRIWFARDTEGMAEMIGDLGANLAPYSVDIGRATPQVDELPQTGETVVRFKNDHLGYALTWFGLAATLVGVYLAFVFHGFRQKEE